MIFLATMSWSADIYIQPYLQSAQPDGMTILWWTEDSFQENYVYYWKTSAAQPTFSAAASDLYVESVGKHLHEVALVGLEENTQYRYYAKSGSFKSKKYTFKTSGNGSFSFVVLGDGRTDNPDVVRNHRQVVELAFEYEPYIACNLGDDVYDGRQIHWDRLMRQIITDSDKCNPGVPFANSIPYYIVVGNHEMSGRESDSSIVAMSRWRAYVSNPNNGDENPNWEERYYSFSYGPASFIILDTNNSNNNIYDTNQSLPDDATPDWAPYSKQYYWLIDELKRARQNSVFTFVMMHQSPYCSGIHGQPGEQESGYGIRVLDPLFRYFEVDAVFSSHDHLVERSLTGPPGYERFLDDNDPLNLNYIVMGNSGMSARSRQPGWESWMSIMNNRLPPYYTRYFYDWDVDGPCDEYGARGGKRLFSFIYVEIQSIKKDLWRATFRVVRTDGKEFDKFSLVRTQPAASKPSNENHLPGGGGYPRGSR
jgi:hypothetical protein